MNKTRRFGLILSLKERQALAQLADAEGGLSHAALIRRLIRNAARERGLWPTTNGAAAQRQEAQYGEH